MTKAKQLGITEFPYKEYDPNMNIIYEEHDSGFWVSYNYNSKNELISGNSSDGIWFIYDYDEVGNRIYYEDSEEYGFFKYYDEFKNIIKTETIDFKKHLISYKRDLFIKNLLNS